jgi:hypothetical protein
MSPQEKKRLSYERDRRNTYGENDKSSRKNIPRAKRRARRANRRLVSTALAAVQGVVVESVAEAAVERINRTRPRAFRKYPDTPLGDVVADRLDRRTYLDEAAAPIETTRTRRVLIRRGHPMTNAQREAQQWISRLAVIDRQIRRCQSGGADDRWGTPGRDLRSWVTTRIRAVRTAGQVGAFPPAEVAIQHARFAAALQRDNVLRAVADLLPDPDTLVRTCLDQIPRTPHEIRAAGPADLRGFRTTKRLIDAATPHGPRVRDPALAATLRTWRRVRFRSS